MYLDLSVETDIDFLSVLGGGSVACVCEMLNLRWDFLFSNFEEA